MNAPGEARRRQREAIRAVLRNVTGPEVRSWDLEQLAEALGSIPEPLADEGLARTRPASAPAVVDTLRALCRQVTGDPPDMAFAYGSATEPYLRIWRLMASPHPDGSEERGLYIEVLAADEPPELHGHPWPVASLLVDGTAVDHGPGEPSAPLAPGTLVLRPRGSLYRLTLGGAPAGPAVLLMATGAAGRPGGSGQRDTPAGDRERPQAGEAAVGGAVAVDLDTGRLPEPQQAPEPAALTQAARTRGHGRSR